jgi:GAF domain-containing protein
MDHHQYESGEGPCVAAAADGEPFHSESLADEERWPTFVPEAIQQGIKSILSTPLIPGDRPIGALNIYSDAERAFGISEQDLAQLFATQASGILADAGADVADDERTALLTDALRSREVIALAQGVLMGRAGVSQRSAASTLRRDAHAAGLTLRQHAENIVQSTQRGEPPSSDG